MKTENKIYIFFIVLALFFWNPLSFYILYADTPIVLSKWYWALNAVIFIAGAFIVWRLRKDKAKKRLKDLALSASFFGIFLGIIVCLNFSLKDSADAALEDKTEQGKIFPSNYTVTNKTIEFDYKIITNSIGLRDQEVNIDKGDKFRILCFGDSWTMGAGVNVENSWPKKMQDFFEENDMNNVEVINCGKGGEYSTKYLEHMKKVVPLLKPDVVIVGILQLDDLAQLYENYKNSKKEGLAEKSSIKDRLKNGFKNLGAYSIGNVLKKLAKPEKSIDLKKGKAESVKDKLNKYDYLQKKQYNLLSDSVRNMFETGNLNPALMQYYTSFTYRNIVFNNPYHEATKFAMDLMNQDLANMKTLCDNNDAELVFASMPMAFFSGHIVLRTPNDVFNDYYLKNNHIDSIYRSLAEQNDLPYIELTNHFINLSPKDKFYYRFDGHPNELGYAEIAEFIGNELIKQKIII